MDNSANSIKKLYYSIGEVSKVTELKQYVLRYWETEFKQLNPSKNKAGNRTYRQKDIDVILNIKDLLYNQKFTIDGARKMLSAEQSISADDSKSESNPEVNLDVLIKVADQDGNSSIGENIFNILNEAGISGELKRVEFVGPQVGEELRDQGGLGMIVALFMILFYVAFRFQYKFALGAVTALGHDVVIILGLFSIFGWDFDLTVLAALLAVIGYSLNDTIVVSDRIRENFRNERVLEPIDMIDLSLNQTLARTIITSLTTLLVLFALFIFGGELIRGFSLALILGVLIGTYSSIYVVANMLMSLTLVQDDLAVPEPEGADFDGMP